MSDTRVGTMDAPLEEAVPEEAPVQAAAAPAEEAPLGDPAPDEELWIGGPTFREIEEWKGTHGDVFVTSVGPDTHYVWRTLTRGEYRAVVKKMEQDIANGMSQADANMNNEEAIAELCVLAPKLTRDGAQGHLAGVASIISQEVMEASGFVALEIRQL